MEEKGQDRGFMKDLLVSIIVPTYNQTDNLKRAVNSLISQTYQNIEIIVIDDNSDINIKSQNLEYFNNLKNNKIIYLQNEKNMGSTASRNKGIFKSRGDYITFLDDDDEYLSNKIEIQLNEMIKHNADFSATNVKLYNENGKLTDVRNRNYLYFDLNEPLLVKHLKYHITSTNTLMFKKDFLISIGGFDEENLGDEFYLMAKAFQKSNNFIHVNSCDVKAYVHSTTGLSSTENKIKGEKKLFEYKMSFDKILSKKDIRYIKMRYYAVFAFAYKKSKKYFKCLFYVIKSFFESPIAFFTLFNSKGK